MKEEDIAIVVFANKKDYFLTKICISSIRYYYPEVEIHLVKDKLNGNFNSRSLEKAFRVNPLNLGRKFFGWGAAKIHFLLSKNLPAKRYLCIDSDIIFLGKVLNKLSQQDGDFVLDAQYIKPPLRREDIDLYIDPKKVKKHYPDYEYPGFFFNTGQILAKPGIITDTLLSECFDPNVYPYYKNRDVFGLVDQAVLNAVIPVLKVRENVSVQTLHFMQWSVSFFEENKNASIKDFEDGKYEFLVHYAGDTRVNDLKKMKGTALLKFFRKEYDHRLSPAGRLLDRLQDKIHSNNFLTNMFFKKNRVLIEVEKMWNK